MTCRTKAVQAMQAIRSFLAAYGTYNASSRQVAERLREQSHREIYRRGRGRGRGPEWIDLPWRFSDTKELACPPR